jgi:hypothetical protein
VILAPTPVVRYDSGMDKSMTINRFEAAARSAKVTALALQARTARDGHGFTADELGKFTWQQWQLLAEAAGVNPPGSDETVQGVVAAVRHLEGRNTDDPFEGL